MLLRWIFRLTLLAAPLMAWGQVPAAKAKQNADDCYVREVKGLPGSHAYAADFLEVIAGDPNSRTKNRDGVSGLTADLSTDVPGEARALYISKSTNGGVTWTTVARINSRYFDSGIDEGLRN